MEDRKQEKKNKSIWDAQAFRRKCIRLIAYVYVFFMVLNRRLPVKIKKRLAISFCSCVVAVVIVFSLIGQRAPRTTVQDMTVAGTLSANHNRVIGGQTGASIEINRSRVSGDSKEAEDTGAEEKKAADTEAGQRNHVVAANDSKSTLKEQPNKIEEQPQVLTQVQALLENNGENKKGVTAAMRYQYPVEIGYDGEQNYDGVQSAADYVKRAVYNITGEDISEEVEARKEDTGEEPTGTEAGSEQGTDEELVPNNDREETQVEKSEESVPDTTQAPEEEEEGSEEETVIADTGYFTVRGNMRPGVDVFVGDITIKPTGVNGFDKVRLGEEGEFVSDLTLTKEAVSECITLYFSDGERITSGVEYTYTKDTAAPVLSFDEERYTQIQGEDKTIFCTNDNSIQMDVSDDADGTTGTGVEKICYVYGEKLKYCIDPSQNMGIEVPDNFYGQIAANCCDAAGNMSDVLSKYFLIENQAPKIQFSQDTLCTAPYTFWVNIGETGHIVSGIQDVKCSVNGKPYQIRNLTTLENTLLDEGLEVPTKCEFSLPFTEEGTYSVVVTVMDNAGNTSTEERMVQVTKPELISVFMPEEFMIHIDPQRLAGREQIYSDDITLKNDSDFDVQVTVKKVEVSIKDEVSDTGIRKDCDMYMIAPDTGEKIPLKKGENKEVYSYNLPKGAQDSIDKLRFVGDTTEGSDAMWRDSDVVVRVELDFSKKG